MKRLWLLCLLTACGGDPAPAGPDLTLTLTTATSRCEFGTAFPLTVVRTFRSHLQPEPWRDDALPPLSLQVLTQERSQTGDRVTETFTCRAHPFATGELVIEGALRASSPTGELVAKAEPLRLQVHSALPADAPGAVEMQRELWLPAPPSRWPYWLLAIAVATTVATLWWRRPVVVPPPPPSPPPPDPRVAAHARLLTLGGRITAHPDAVPAHHEELAAILREYVTVAGNLPAATRTSEELIAALQQRPVPIATDAMRTLLSTCDLVKFARHLPSVADSEATVATATRLFALPEGQS